MTTMADMVRGTLLWSLLVTTPAAAQDAPWGKCSTEPPDTAVQTEFQSIYLAMPDGVRIAADVILPRSLSAGKRLPTILTATRYWRAVEGMPVSPEQLDLVRRGYAVVSTDVRGTGASFGTWLYPWSRTEIADLGQVIAWIASQPWSNAKVATIGTSYTANTAQVAAAANPAALKAVVPRFMDFDAYSDLTSPGGLINEFLLREWGRAVHAMDMNEKRGSPPVGVRPVDADRDHSLLAAAISDHRANPPLDVVALKATYRDDSLPEWETSNDVTGTYRYRREIEGSAVPIFGWASWLDAGTSSGLINRYLNWRNPQYVVIGAWSHGGGHNASPFVPVDAPPSPDRAAQSRAALCFFDEFLKGQPNAMGERRLFYYTMGEERWKSTTTWPLPGTSQQRWYLAPGHALSRVAADGTDDYTVDFEATTGTQNRWYTQMGGSDVVYPDRAEADARLLSYTTAPLDRDVEVTGNPIVTLRLATTASDGSFIAYLEDVAPDGTVRYVTEGQLRGLHRKVSADPPPYRILVPYHSFLRKDGAPMVPSQVTTLQFGLIPTSVVFRKGHRIRLALSGADKDTFKRIPETGGAAWTVHHSATHPSYVELPVVSSDK